MTETLFYLALGVALGFVSYMWPKPTRYLVSSITDVLVAIVAMGAIVWYVRDDSYDHALFMLAIVLGLVYFARSNYECYKEGSK